MIIEQKEEIISVFPFLSTWTFFYAIPNLNIFPRFIFLHLLGKTYYVICICFHFDLFLVHIILIKEHS